MLKSNHWLQQQWKQGIRGGNFLSLMMIDIDFLKVYNDYYSISIGDDCLRKIAQLINDFIEQQVDLASRYDGQVFAIILPNTSLEKAVPLAELIQHKLHRLNIPHAASPISDRITVSIGISGFRPQFLQNNTDARLLIDTAEQALKQGKHQGRNCIVVHEKAIEKEQKVQKCSETLYNLFKFDTLTDTLTKLSNRHAFNNFLQQEWKKGIRGKQFLSLIMINKDEIALYPS